MFQDIKTKAMWWIFFFFQRVQLVRKHTLCIWKWQNQFPRYLNFEIINFWKKRMHRQSIFAWSLFNRLTLGNTLKKGVVVVIRIFVCVCVCFDELFAVVLIKLLYCLISTCYNSLSLLFTAQRGGAKKGEMGKFI